MASQFTEEQLRQLATFGSADGVTLNSLTVENLAKELYLTRAIEPRRKRRLACLSAAGDGDGEFPPYSADEQRVCDYLLQITNDIGCGDDPIGFLIASHRVLSQELSALRLQFRE